MKETATASPAWLANLIGEPGAPKRPLRSARVRVLAELGATAPAKLSLLDIQEISASVIDHIARQK